LVSGPNYSGEIKVVPIELLRHGHMRLGIGATLDSHKIRWIAALDDVFSGRLNRCLRDFSKLAEEIAYLTLPARGS
jgi:hypothetical protein